MRIDSIKDGIVLDHISAGKCMQIYRYLGLNELDCSVAIIKNAPSNKTGRKDIIKIADEFDVNLDILGYIDPGITVCYIKDYNIVRKAKLALPKRIVNILRCKNPRCITSVEDSLDQIFFLADEKNRIYRCAYCEARKSEY